MGNVILIACVTKALSSLVGMAGDKTNSVFINIAGFSGAATEVAKWFVKANENPTGHKAINIVKPVVDFIIDSIF